MPSISKRRRASNLELLLAVNRKSFDGAEKIGQTADDLLGGERQAVAATANHVTNGILPRPAALIRRQ